MERKALLSKIVKRDSAEVKTISVNAKQDNVARPIGDRAFQGLKVEGVYTELEVQALIAEAIQRSRQEVEKEVHAKVNAPLRTALQNVENILEELSRYRRELFKESERDLVEIVRMVSKKVLQRELELAPESLLKIVERALEFVERHRRVALLVNAKNLEQFQKAKPDFLARFKGLEEISIVADQRVADGTAVLKTHQVDMQVAPEAMVDQILNEVRAAQVGAPEVNDEGDTLK